MSAAIRIIDATPSGQALNEQRLELRLASETLTVRELIVRRVEAEVLKHNSQPGRLVYNGLVQPADAERTLNGCRLLAPRALDAEEQTRLAVDAFDHGRFLLLVGDRQFEGLDEVVLLESETLVQFIKLLPLVGG